MAGKDYNRSMLDAALKFLVGEVNGYLLRRTGDADNNKLLLGPLVDDKGNLLPADNVLVLTLFQIEEERALNARFAERTLVGLREVTRPAPLRLNLTLLLSARFANYETGLRRLSLAMTFLHAQPVFMPANAPAMPEGIEQMTLEMVNQTPEQLNQMWACMGAKYQPSAVYRLRMLLLQDDEPSDAGQPITHIQATLGSR